MKTICLLLVLFIVCALGGIQRMNKNSGRTAVPETVDFQLLYLGTCDQFYSTGDVHVSDITSLLGCLPINATTGTPDRDDLTAHVLCTNIGPGRAQIDFVEIFRAVDDDFPSNAFVISFIPNRPFKAVSGGVTYLRRPSCTTNKDYCSNTNYVHTCTENAAAMRNGFVVSNDLVYIVPNGQSAVGCGLGINSCCVYLPSSPFGICPFTAENTLLNYDWDRFSYGNNNNHHNDHHNEQHHGHDDDHHGHNDDNNHHGHNDDNNHGHHDDDNHNSHGHPQGNHLSKQEEPKPQANIQVEEDSDDKKKK